MIGYIQASTRGVQNERVYIHNKTGRLQPLRLGVWLMNSEGKKTGKGATANLPGTRGPPTKLPLLKSLETTKEKSKELRTKVKESLSSLTPRENIYTLPNILTVTRLIAAPVVGYLVLHEQHVWALGLFAYAGVTDLIDGWIARKWKLQTVVGTVIDPMADKTLMTVLTITLAMNGALPGRTHLALDSPSGYI
ncbi:hypothetical protein B0A49_09540 [Cryomyces minteri]|uniref:Uncharacterized protein n=1 Tax=Cryomyces minteri TaxID=331657 RepID=A0A4U0WRR4_9PEZI|nr:hypothetical protein B0A49_09540 [Cryomyces minteri]